MGNNKISKTALGAERSVVWEYAPQTRQLLLKLRAERIHMVALEQSRRSVDYRKYKPRFPMTLVLGNEVRGLSPAILKLCDNIIELPMRGKKESLNVTVAAGVALYTLIK